MNAAHYPFFRKLLILILVFNLLVGCVPPAEPGPAVPEASQEPVSSDVQDAAPTAPFEDVADGGEEVRFVDGPVEDLLGELPSLGSITFTIDSAHQSSGEFVPGGAGLVLSLTDSAGLTWTLTLTPDALDTTENITMTALSEVQSTTIPGSHLGGVLLEPDGLQLLEPGTLTVTGGGLEGKALFLSGSHDGTNVNFALQETGGSSSGAVIQHFSSYTVIHSEDPKIGELRDQEIQHYKELAQKARELLKNKNIDVPRPPSIPLTCPKDEDETRDRQKASEKFEEDFRKPESKLLDQLIASQVALEHMGREPEFTVEVRLLERLIKKVNLLIKEYGNQPENVIAITQVGYTVARQMALTAPNHPGSIEVVEALGRMCERVIDKLLKELREEHEYRNVGPILEMSRRAALIGVNTIPVEDLIARIEAAMNFELEVTYDLTIAGNQKYEFKGETPVRIDYASTGNLNTLHGLGMGELVSFKNTREPSITVEAPNFQFEVLFSDFDPCKGTANMLIDRMTPDSEVVNINGEMSATLPVAYNCWMATYEKYLGTHPAGGELYTFPVKLHNGDPVAVEAVFEETAPASKGNVTGIFRVKLTHEPGGR